MRFKLPKNVSKALSKAALRMRKASPTILVLVGVGAMIGGTVLACKAAREMDEPIDEAKREIEDIHRHEQEDEAFAKSKEAPKEKLKVWAKLFKRMAVLFGKSAIVTGVGVVCIFGGYNILKARYLGLAAAYSAASQEALIANAKLQSEQSKTINENGEVTKEPVKKFAPDIQYYYSEPDENSLTPMGAYAFKFDKDNCPFGSHGDYTMDYLTAIHTIRSLSDLLESSISGFVFYDECLRRFGVSLPDNKSGRQWLAMSKSVGWMREDGKQLMMNGTSPEYSGDPAVITAYEPQVTVTGDTWWKKYIIIDPMCRRPDATYFGPILERVKA